MWASRAAGPGAAGGSELAETALRVGKNGREAADSSRNRIVSGSLEYKENDCPAKAPEGLTG
jgi:hypothetical protein